MLEEQAMALQQTKQNKKPIEPYLITYTKVHLKWFIDLNIKAKGHKNINNKRKILKFDCIKF